MRLTSGSAEDDILAWVPDGESVLVSTAAQTRTRILRVVPDGTVIRALATGGGWSGHPSVGEARFCGNGRTVAYTVSSRTVWLMNADGSGKHRLTPGGRAGVAVARLCYPRVVPRPGQLRPAASPNLAEVRCLTGRGAHLLIVKVFDQAAS